MTDAPPGGEPADPLLRAVAEYWDDIIGRADQERAARLRALVDGTAEPDPVEARAALGDELLDLLPPDHPVSRARRANIMYVTMAPDPGARLADGLRWLWTRVAGSQPGDAPPGDGAVDLDELDRQVRARLLSLPSLTADEVLGSHVDPAGTGLIRLAGPDRQVRLPAFQFAPDGRLPGLLAHPHRIARLSHDAALGALAAHRWAAGQVLSLGDAEMLPVAIRVAEKVERCLTGGTGTASALTDLRRTRKALLSARRRAERGKPPLPDWPARPARQAAERLQTLRGQYPPWPEEADVEVNGVDELADGIATMATSLKKASGRGSR